MELFEVYCKIRAFSLMLRPSMGKIAKHAYEQYVTSLDEKIKKKEIELINFKKIKQNLRREMTEAQIKFRKQK